MQDYYEELMEVRLSQANDLFFDEDDVELDDGEEL